MKSYKTSDKKLILKYGIILGLGLSCNTLFHRLTEKQFSRNNIAPFVELMIYIIIVIYTIFQHQKNNNQLSLKKAIIFGTLTGVIGGIVHLFIAAAFFFIIDQHSISQSIEDRRESFIQDNPLISEKDLNQKLETISWYNDTNITVLWAQLLLDIILVFLFSLIAGAILSKKKKINT